MVYFVEQLQARTSLELFLQHWQLDKSPNFQNVLNIYHFVSLLFSIVGNPMICATEKEQECSGTTPLPLSFNLSSSQ
ncbi:hypothetical protein IFM89_006441, partial [Coptis chinensis]